MVAKIEEHEGVHYLKIVGRNKQMVNVAVLGYGTVGSGVVEVFRLNQSRIDKCAGTEVRLKYVLDLRDFPGILCRILLSMILKRSWETKKWTSW